MPTATPALAAPFHPREPGDEHDRGRDQGTPAHDVERDLSLYGFGLRVHGFPFSSRAMSAIYR